MVDNVLAVLNARLGEDARVSVTHLPGGAREGTDRSLGGGREEVVVEEEDRQVDEESEEEVDEEMVEEGEEKVHHHSSYIHNNPNHHHYHDHHHEGHERVEFMVESEEKGVNESYVEGMEDRKGNKIVEGANDENILAVLGARVAEEARENVTHMPGGCREGTVRSMEGGQESLLDRLGEEEMEKQMEEEVDHKIVEDMDDKIVEESEEEVHHHYLHHNHHHQDSQEVVGDEFMEESGEELGDESDAEGMEEKVEDGEEHNFARPSKILREEAGDRRRNLGA